MLKVQWLFSFAKQLIAPARFNSTQVLNYEWATVEFSCLITGGLGHTMLLWKIDLCHSMFEEWNADLNLSLISSLDFLEKKLEWDRDSTKAVFIDDQNISIPVWGFQASNMAYPTVEWLGGYFNFG
jgi:hypothetical protein